MPVPIVLWCFGCCAIEVLVLRCCGVYFLGMYPNLRVTSPLLSRTENLEQFIVSAIKRRTDKTEEAGAHSGVGSGRSRQSENILSWYC